MSSIIRNCSLPKNYVIYSEVSYRRRLFVPIENIILLVRFLSSCFGNLSWVRWLKMFSAQNLCDIFWGELQTKIFRSGQSRSSGICNHVIFAIWFEYDNHRKTVWYILKAKMVWSSQNRYHCVFVRFVPFYFFQLSFVASR